MASEEEATLEERYAAIKAAQSLQEANYASFLASLGSDFTEKMVADAAALGLSLDLGSGQISYGAEFAEKRLQLRFDLIYCRHGKTEGNTEPRIYQGFVDEPKNALNEIGRGQAEAAADKLDAMGLAPDLVILSPLSRAADTGRAFLNRHPELEDRTEVWPDTAEMMFGSWDNVRVRDLADENICHLFYLTQNAMVKSMEPYLGPDGQPIPGENFVELLTRMHAVLRKIDQRFEVADKRPLVVMYGHSMAGAALSILTGNGKEVDGTSHLGFDGKYIMPNATPVFLHHSGKHGSLST